MRCQSILEFVHAADRPDGEHSQNDDGRHLDHELNEVRPQHGPHSSPGRVGDGDHEANADGDDFARHGLPEDGDIAETERDRENLDHRLGDPAEDDQVDRYREIKCAEAAQYSRRPTAVSDLGELDVRHHVGSAPKAREKEHGEHSAHQHVPP